MRSIPRIVIATRIFTPEVAAASFRLGALARALHLAGARVLVLTSRPVGTVSRSSDKDGVLVRRSRTFRGPDGYIRGYAQYLTFDFPLIGRMLVLHPRPDVLVAEPPPTTGCVVRVVSCLLRVPYVYYAADVWSDASESMDVPGVVVAALRALERFALRGAASVIAVNGGVAERVRQLGAHDVSVVLNGIDTAVFAPRPSGVKTRPEGMPDHFLIYAGTASEWQGAGVFVDAFRRLEDDYPDLRLVYMGQGSDLPAIRERADDDPRILFIGQRSPEEAALWQAEASAALVSIVPGRGYDFAYPTKVLAALACGTPVVYAGTGPVVDDVREADLGVAADHDADSVARAVRDVLDHPRDPDRLRAWVQEHRSLEATGRDAARVVLDVATGSRRG